eukprot:Blabericola_migrator_1__1121@NODE_1288_length_4887_cov_7_457261_g870_i0_p1_GENE_NODE_1288_length_4887_cov_7_457261_g870_i0NODE_1288_length_4887_cov_7_457261_g870_i0_p1_ORF_typecomplete_len299_score11_86_NODE_1288_length_4887_cov_7_457261_g870_i026903586
MISHQLKLVIMAGIVDCVERSRHRHVGSSQSVLMGATPRCLKGGQGHNITMPSSLRLNPTLHREISVRNVITIGLVCVAGGNSPAPGHSGHNEGHENRRRHQDTTPWDPPRLKRRAYTTASKSFQNSSEAKQRAGEVHPHSSLRADPDFDRRNETGPSGRYRGAARQDLTSTARQHHSRPDLSRRSPERYDHEQWITAQMPRTEEGQVPPHPDGSGMSDSRTWLTKFRHCSYEVKLVTALPSRIFLTGTGLLSNHTGNRTSKNSGSSETRLENFTVQVCVLLQNRLGSGRGDDHRTST